MTVNPPPIIYLALGTNLGDRFANLQAAIAALPPAVRVLAQSPVYETPPWGLTDQPAFLNMVLKGQTALAPVELLKHLKLLETELGRLPTVRWGPRRIDMDILFYDKLILDTPELTIPHPRLHERAFVLVPLADLEPDLVHPVLGATIKQLRSALDTTGVKRYEPTD
ncbi:MAG: 2-amino-4-hydroxy-6-hydroxymethyldihydropteridine diphosphokinase [Chloroflexi bacterium]|nr:2-amino-4-hydroxy-6-hydroxymethyldihydropteridine diphosphokinase [Chloroflexota bacterium]